MNFLIGLICMMLKGFRGIVGYYQQELVLVEKANLSKCGKL